MPFKEATLVQNIRDAVKREYPTALVRKLADKSTRGIPDLIIQFRRRPEFVSEAGTLWVETKTETGRTSAIQDAEHFLIERAGGVVIVARTVQCVLDKMEEMGACP